jgi:hypothetical protein
MRRIVLATAVVAVCGLVHSASGQQPVTTAGCASCGQTQQVCAAGNCGHRNCGSHGYGGVPGCCRCAPSQYDNVWDGFCDEKQRCRQRLRETFWFIPGCGYETVSYQTTIVTTAATTDTTTDTTGPTMVAPQHQDTPAAPMPAAPKPAPEVKAPDPEAEKATQWPWIPKFW